MFRMNTRLTLMALALLTLLLIAGGGKSIATPPDVVYKVGNPSNAPDRLYLLTLQGLVARTKPEIWLTRSETTRWLDDLVTNYGVTIVNVSDRWWLLDHFLSRVSGYVLCNVGDASQNVGVSMAGLLNAIAVTTANESNATARGLTRLADVRTRDDNWCYTNYWSQFNHNIAFEQEYTNADLASFLYDYAVYKQGMCMYRGTDVQDSLRRTIASALNDHSPVLGWAAASYEGNWVRDLSQSVSGGVAANAFHNASLLSQVPVSLPVHQNHMPGNQSTETSVHYCSFIMTDGDNIQWLERSFYDSIHWGSAYRGTFNMGWEFSPSLLDHAPTILKKYYQEASSGTYKDYFISSPYGYMLLSADIYPSGSRAGYATKLQPYLTNADMSIVNVIFYNSATYSSLDNVLDLSNVWGMTVKSDGANYDAGNGYIYWRNGKPAVNYKYFISSGHYTPSSCASALNARPRNPKTDQNSYSFIAVNAWNTDPMADIHNCIASLASAVRVVTPETLIYHLRKNFGTPVEPPQDTQAPSVPTNVTAAPHSSTSVMISWTASTDNWAVAGYKIYRNGSLAGTSTTTNYLNTGLTANTTYSYTVSAYDGAGNNSAQSSPVATTKTPLQLTVTDLVPVTYQWTTFDIGSTFFIDRTYTISTMPLKYRGFQGIRTANDDKNNASLDFHFTISTMAEIYICLTDSLLPTTPLLSGFVDTGDDIGTTDQNYSVYHKLYPAGLVNLGPKPSPESGSSMYWVMMIAASDTQAPSIPTNVQAAALSENSIQVTWTASTDNIGVTGYKVYRDGGLAGTSASTSFTNTGLSPSTTYSYTVSAYDAASNNSAQSSPPVTVCTSDNIPPSVPEDVSAVSQTPRQVKITWSASTDNVGVVGYKIYRDGGQVGTSVATNYTDTDLSSNTTYSYTVSAYDIEDNESSQSSPPETVTTLEAKNISAAKLLPNSSPVGMVSKTVTAIFAGIFYVEESDRYSGIKIVPIEMPVGLNVGSVVDIGGTIQTTSGERYIGDATAVIR